MNLLRDLDPVTRFRTGQEVTRRDSPSSGHLVSRQEIVNLSEIAGIIVRRDVGFGVLAYWSCHRRGLPLRNERSSLRSLRRMKIVILTLDAGRLRRRACQVGG